MRTQGPAVGLGELRERGWKALRGLVEWEVQQHFDLPVPRGAGERHTDMRDRVEVVRRGNRRLDCDRSATHAVDAERPQVLATVVPRREVPASRMDDEAVRAQLPLRLVTRERPVPGAEAQPAADRVAEQQCKLRRHGCTARRGHGVVERRLQSLDLTAQDVREHPVDLGERAVDRVRRPAEAEPSGGDRPERDHDRLVVGEHERRQPVPGADPVAAADAALALDRDAELLEPRDVPPDRARVDGEAIRDLPSRRHGLRLQELKQLEEASGRSEHSRSEAQIEG